VVKSNPNRGRFAFSILSPLHRLFYFLVNSQLPPSVVFWVHIVKERFFLPPGRGRQLDDYIVFCSPTQAQNRRKAITLPPKVALGRVPRWLSGPRFRPLLAKRGEQMDRTVWQKRYYDFNQFSDHKRIEKLRYMHWNPVKRGLVEKPEDWKWSSYCHYLTGMEGLVEIESEWTARKREKMGILPRLKRRTLE
jgi:hypothetical protein